MATNTMKIKVTKKEIVENYNNVICIGYCELQSLLNYENARFYTCGVYGWNADVYEINGSTVIVTGYRPFGNIKVDYETQRKYEAEAQRIQCDYSIKYEARIEALKKLVNEFVTMAINNK